MEKNQQFTKFQSSQAGGMGKKEQCPGLIDDYEELQRLAAKVDGAERVTVLR